MFCAPVIRNALSVTAMIFAVTACGPAPEKSSDSTQNADRLQPVQLPEKGDVSPEKIAGDIVGRVVRVSDVSGAGDPTEWTFEKKEFRHVEVLERKVTGNTQTLVIFLTTRSNPEADEEQVQVSGKLQLHYERKSGQWVLTGIENLSFRYSVGVAT
jgi:hypothetical protein